MPVRLLMLCLLPLLGLPVLAGPVEDEVQHAQLWHDLTLREAGEAQRVAREANATLKQAQQRLEEAQRNLQRAQQQADAARQRQEQAAAALNTADQRLDQAWAALDAQRRTGAPLTGSGS